MKKYVYILTTYNDKTTYMEARCIPTIAFFSGLSDKPVVFPVVGNSREVAISDGRKVN